MNFNRIKYAAAAVSVVVFFAMLIWGMSVFKTLLSEEKIMPADAEALEAVAETRSPLDTCTPSPTEFTDEQAAFIELNENEQTIEAEEAGEVEEAEEAGEAEATEETEQVYNGSVTIDELGSTLVFLEPGNAQLFPGRCMQFTNYAVYYADTSGMLYRRDNVSGKERLIAEKSSNIGSCCIIADNEECVYYIERDDDFPFGDNYLGMRFRFYEYHIETKQSKLIYSFVGDLWSAVFYEGSIYCGVRFDDPEPNNLRHLIRISPDTGKMEELFADTADYTPCVFGGQLFVYRYLYFSDDIGYLDVVQNQVFRLDASGNILQTMMDIESSTLLPYDLYISEDGAYISDGKRIYHVDPDTPEKLVPVCNRINEGFNLNLVGATNTHLYLQETSNDHASSGVYVYSYEISTGEVLLEWKSGE